MSVGTDEIIEFYNNRLSRSMGQHSIHNGRINKVRHMLNSIIHPWMSVLDVGCGIGVTAKHMADIGAEVVAVDIAPKLIDHAKEHFGAREITYIACDILDFKTDQEFDAIVFVDIIEHIKPENLSLIIANLANNTHSDTLIYISIPDANFINFMIKHYKDKLQIIDEPYSVEFITSLFSRFGFKPSYINIYGLDTKVQYNEYIFQKPENLNHHYKDRLDKIYNH